MCFLADEQRSLMRLSMLVYARFSKENSKNKINYHLKTCVAKKEPRDSFCPRIFKPYFSPLDAHYYIIFDVKIIILLKKYALYSNSSIYRLLYLYFKAIGN